LLVDPAWHADELEGIADLLTARDLRVELGWATHAHHGHSPGHGALWLPEVRVLLAGDMLSETEIPLCAETGIDVYGRGLERLAPYVARAQVLVPGHGSPAYADTQDSPTGRLAADRAYLDALAAGTGEQDPRLRDAPDWLLAEHEANAA